MGDVEVMASSQQSAVSSRAFVSILRKAILPYSSSNAPVYMKNKNACSLRVGGGGGIVWSVFVCAAAVCARCISLRALSCLEEEVGGHVQQR